MNTTTVYTEENALGAPLLAKPGNGVPLLSVLKPAYNEARNLPVLYARLTKVLDTLSMKWEWIVIDDHSADETFSVVAEMARFDPRVRAVRLARNFGAHNA